MQRYAARSEESFGFCRSVLPLSDVISAVARRLWPVKTARNLASRAGTTHRAAESWLAGQTGLSGEALAELLRSDAGLAVLDAVMGERKPSWWPTFQRAVQMDLLNARIDAVQADLDRLAQ